MMKLAILLFCCSHFVRNTVTYRLATVEDILSTALRPNYSFPLDTIISRYGDPMNFQRERVNEGSADSATQDLLFEGTNPRQNCPAMIGPFSDGSYYCTAREYGYCDRRSGTCFCNTGYQGIDCSECQTSHFMMGNLCYSKKLCPNDCGNAGSCNFNNGTCACMPHRSGISCEKKLCTMFSTLCNSCNTQQCLSCISGFYLLEDKKVCSGCNDFDPRCGSCTKELGCSSCQDSVLNSVRRSGYRYTDAKLPLEENTRELGISIPFGSKDPAIFDAAELYHVVGNMTSIPLHSKTMSCAQGLNNDASVVCTPYVTSHVVCGNKGVFSFSYPDYHVNETVGHLRLTVRRTGGGHGDVYVDYFIRHITTNDSHVSATAQYTTSQTLAFTEGIVERSFLVKILHDSLPGPTRVFQVYLGTPVGGGILGAQFRTNVTIFDSDTNKISAHLTKPINVQNTNALTQTAGYNFTITIQANNLKYVPSASSRRLNTIIPETMGGELFLSIIENDFTFESTRFQRNNVRKIANMTDNGDGTYSFVSFIDLQGSIQQRIFLALPNGLNGKYYSDTFFTNLVVDRIDSVVNFTWGLGGIIPSSADYVSVRWSGAILIPLTGYYWFNVHADDMARLWVNGDLILDHFTQQRTYREQARRVYLHASTLYEVELEYLELTGDAFCTFFWSASRGGTYASPRDLLPSNIIPSMYLYSLSEINTSPIILDIKSDVTAASVTECYGDGLFGAQSGVTSYFTCCPRDQYGNLRNDGNITLLSSELLFGSLVLVGDAYMGGSGPDSIEVSRTYDVSTSCFNFHYTAQRGGLFALNVTYQSWYNQPMLPVRGSPFLLSITSNQESASSGSELSGSITTTPINVFVAGKCYNFTIVARDGSGILRFKGGDTYETYLYMTALTTPPTGLVPPGYNYPTMSPTQTAPPTSSPTLISLDSGSASTTGATMVRYGVVTDLEKGNYSCKICPIIAGNYKLEVRYMGTAGSTGGDYKYFGLNVGSAPFSVVVVNSLPLGSTSSVVNYFPTVNVTVPTSIIVTVRDPYFNIVLNHKANITVTINGLPAKNVTIFNFRNGSYFVHYTPSESGVNNVVVKVNNQNIIGGPFKQIASDVSSNAKYSYVVGANLFNGVSGVISYFELFAYGFDKLRISNNDELYTFGIRSADFKSTNINSTGIDFNYVNGTLLPCPSPPIIGHVACNSYDNELGHYYGSYTPIKKGKVLHYIFYNPDKTGASGYTQVLVPLGPFIATIIPGNPDYLNSIVRGDLYSSTAGVQSYVTVQLQDSHRNFIAIGGSRVQVAILQVAGWSTYGPSNTYGYGGFAASYLGSPMYLSVMDTGDGTYIAPYVLYVTGEYMMRVSMLAPGLNATYFKGTSFGRLRGNSWNKDFTLENTISWTGNIPTTGYSDFYTSIIEDTIAFDLRHPDKSENSTGKYTAFPNQKNSSTGKVSNPFRENYWSARWVGMITAEHSEEYSFSVVADGNSDIRVYIGGSGTALNSSQPGVLIINSTSQGPGSTTGKYDFRNNGSSEIIVEYAHYMEDGYFSLYWQSISTVFSVIPSSAFSNYQNISFSNITVGYESAVSALHSTAYGNALTTANVGVLQIFQIFSRDRFRNLVLESGGNYPSMFAVSPTGTIIRGDVQDYGNGTYSIQYLPVKSGEYRMFVSIGCCALHPDVGIASEISGILSRSLLLSGSPYYINISPAVPVVSLLPAQGSGLSGGSAGDNNTFSVFYRDFYKNPAQNVDPKNIKCIILINDLKTEDTVIFSYTVEKSLLDSFTVSYSIGRAGTYAMSVYVQLNHSNFIQNNSPASDSGHILGSPFTLIIGPGTPSPLGTICQGLDQKIMRVNVTHKFQIRLYDQSANALATGGAHYFIRILGGNLESQSVFLIESPGVGGSNSTIPVCVDNLNGKYVCTFTMIRTGYHLLHISLLPTSLHPGGNGLTGTYYDGYEGASGLTKDSIRDSVVIKTDSSVSFSWVDGNIIPSSMKIPSDYLPLHANGQSVQWEGYLVSPKTDLFNIIARVDNMNATIYIDNFIVYDTISKISTSVALQTSSAYQIRIEAKTRNSICNKAVSISLMWAATTTKSSIIPQFFLYNSATEIPLSPYMINVVG